ncbi:MAG: uroporphyrinogen-III C-methyltransferase [Cellvibrionaceae bacterium]
MTGDKTTTEPSKKEDDNKPEKTTEKDKANVTTSPATTSVDKKDNKTATTTSEKTKSKKSGLGLSLVFFLIILIALGVGAYFGWQFWTDYSAKQEQRLQALETNAATQRSDVKRLSEQQNSQSSDQTSVLQAIQKDQQLLQQRLDSHTQRIRALAGTSRDDWLLAEARYLLRLASQRLLVERGTEGAQGLLQSADGILQSVDDAGVLPVREAIAKEIIALKLAKTVDRQGIYLQLSALKSQIQQLPLIPFQPELETETLSVKPTETQENDPWYFSTWNSIKNALLGLSQHVQVSNINERAELLVSEEGRLQVINNIMLMFEQAQFALLHEEEKIYKDSLNKALDWWNVYYSHYSEYEIVRSELKRLQAINVIQELPAITRSSELLTDYIERFHRLNQAEPTNNASEIETNVPDTQTNAGDNKEPQQ